MEIIIYSYRWGRRWSKRLSEWVLGRGRSLSNGCKLSSKRRKRKRRACWLRRGVQTRFELGGRERPLPQCWRWVMVPRLCECQLRDWSFQRNHHDSFRGHSLQDLLSASLSNLKHWAAPRSHLLQLPTLARINLPSPLLLKRLHLMRKTKTISNWISSPTPGSLTPP